jgi:Zn-dependent protease with chaperone function
MTIIKATRYAPHASQSTPIELELQQSSLKFRTADGESLFELNEVKISDQIGNSPRQLLLPDGQLIVITQPEQFNFWLKNKKSASKSHYLEQNKAVFLVAIILVPFLIFMLYRFAIPAAALHFSKWVPKSAIKISSNHTLMSLDKTILSPSTLPAETKTNYQKHWQTMFNQLTDQKDKYHVQFRQSETLGANAFALPDGTLVVTDSLIELMKETPQAIDAVLLHEVGHVEKYHSMRLITESISNAIVVNYLFGDLSGIVDLVMGTGTTLLNNKFSQNLELEADNYAIQQLITHQRSPEEFGQALKLLAEKYSDGPFDKLLSSHPLLKDRINNVNAQSVSIK